MTQSVGVNDFERIGKIIQYLDEHHSDQPELGSLARLVGLSPAHFHRLFSRWAGITPKDFIQCLTLTEIKRRLRRQESVLQASLESGLSGPGRAHDLCVTLESASPGELKSGGEGWRIQFGFAESPFGRSLIGVGPRGICHLSFTELDQEEQALAELGAEWPKASIHRADPLARRLAAEIFGKSDLDQSASGLKAFVRGSVFQVKVWRALMEIPVGKLVSYGELARKIGLPGATRAVGTAVGRNPISYLVPCHRVIRETGLIGNYRWGRERKTAMLAWEQGRIEV